MEQEVDKILDKMSLFQKIHFITHNRHDVNMYIYTNTTRERKEKNRTKETSQLCYDITRSSLEV